MLLQVRQQQERSGTSCIAGKSDKCRKNYPKQKQKKNVKLLLNVMKKFTKKMSKNAMPTQSI